MAVISLLQTPNRQSIYDALISYADGSCDSRWFAQIIASWQVGDGVLPDYLGLDGCAFQQMLNHVFPGVRLDSRLSAPKSLDFSRMLEKQDLEQLLRQHAQPRHPTTEWFIAMLVAACLGNDHLWQDIGLWSRDELSALLHAHFPTLAQRNTGDMKWKKFLYKQLCEAEGLYVCRAPSCELCKDYLLCFGPEE